mmetsp:Transcript_12527/g.23509  ORF Transcript_12527/g.23509 Transcript_12527/m.23509 type:complete len:794 (-) Transcript_12527:131-2512(-)
MSNTNGTAASSSNSRKSPTPGDAQQTKEVTTSRTSSSTTTTTTTTLDNKNTSAAMSASASASAMMTDDDHRSNEPSRKRSKRIMHISSDEINVLVYRYLQEAGFVHSAFTFAYESMLGRTNTSKANVPPGALISFLQKGLQYVGIEETLRQDATPPDRTMSSATNNGQEQQQPQQNTQQEMIDFTLLSPHSIQALTRKNPPIQINVPPATAAAAIKAKLEMEANHGMGIAMNTNTTGTATATSGAFYNKNNHSTAIVTNSNSSNNIHDKNAQDRYRQTMQGGRMLVDGRLSTAAAAAAVGYGQHQEHPPMHMVGGIPPPSLPHQQLQEQQQQQQKRNATVKGPQERHNMYMNDNVNEQTKAAAVALASINTQSARGDMTNAGFQSLKSIVSKEIGAVMGQPPPSSTSSSLPLLSEKINDEKMEEEDLLKRAKPDEVLELNKHTSEVFMCAWNPVYTDLLATGSGDASARIWKMAGKNAKKGSDICRLLQHGTNPSDQKNKDVTTLEWSSNGEMLATGSYDGVARVWSRTGAIVHTLRGHIGPIFSLKWNKSGKFLLSGSYDKTTIVWDVSGETGEIKQQFMHHLAPALDVDWKDDLTFASCSTDKTVLICKVGVNAPLHRFIGHQDEVNAVKWDPSGSLLASCSDDFTAKVWDLTRGNANPLYDFTSHKQEIYTVKWSPTGPGSKNPDKPRMLATASFDSTVRLWNIENGSCLAVLSRHKESVYSVAFSPSGDYLASGSLAGQLYVWRLKDGKQIKNFKGNGDIFEVAWNKEETRIAACFSSNVVNVIDFKAG